MSPLSATPAVAAVYPRADAPEASRTVASERAAKAVEATNAQTSARALGTPAIVAHVMDGLSTVQVAGAMGSIPAALGRMRDIAMAASSDSLTDADRATLQAEYSQLSKQLASVVGSVTANEHATTTSDKGDEGSGDDASRSEDDGSPGEHAKNTHLVRAKTASPASTVARAHATREPARPVAPRTASGRAASAAQFAQVQQHATPARGRISVVA